MKIILRFILLVSATFFASSTCAAEVSSFANFQGHFSRHGRVSVSENGASLASGKIRQSFHIGAGGESARLKITGTLRFQNAVRPFTAIYVFKKRSSDGIAIAEVSNLAPGVDDGFFTKKGTYALSPRQITAAASFVFGTTTGETTLLLHLKRRPKGLQLILVQTLVTSALSRPITWTFKAVSPRD